MTTLSQTTTKSITTWLFTCAGLVAAMVVLGAVTRLTDSGLSIVEWRPLMGALPPLSEEEWGRVFLLYQDSPEFQKKHFWMELSDFKRIFFWEWFHRLLGRLIGIVYALPLIWFWVKGQIPQGYKFKFLGLFILGGLQGLMGWYMVKSGLVDEPAVSHYRLAAHLSLALLIYSLLIWFGLSLKKIQKKRDPVLYGHGWLALGSFILTVFWGAYTAGLDAGLIYNEFPLMGGRFIPTDLWFYEPFWVNFFETHGGVQFAHRWLAIFSALMILSLWAHGVHRRIIFPALHALGFMILVQAGLGILTLLSQVAMPLAVLHQFGALFVLTLLIVSLKVLKP